MTNYGDGTSQPPLSRARLGMRDFTLLTDVTQVMNECPTPLSFVEILGKFRRIGLEVHPPALEAIFDAVDSQGEGVVQPRNFMREYNGHVQQLSQEVFELREKIESLQGLIEALRDQIQSPATSETLNSWGISESSSLKVALSQVSGLVPPHNCYVVVVCERQRQVSKTIVSSATEGWGQEMEFRVVNGAGDVLVSLYSDNELLGQTAIALPSLRDQKLHETWHDLASPGRSSKLRILLGLQWLHNLRSHLQDEIVTHLRSMETTMEAVRGAESLLGELGLGGEEEWMETVVRKLQVSFERMKQTSCSTDCSLM